MKKILFLPFLQIPSGHHQVAHALIDQIEKQNPNVDCKKIDLLSYKHAHIESLTSKTYLNWIHHWPKTYSWTYRKLVYSNPEKDKRFFLYELLFLSTVKKLLTEEKPDLIICTHALPSYILNYLKEKEQIKVPILNVYTDYFVHSLWGVTAIDYHFVASYLMKEFLIKKGVKPSSIFVTGIPVHPQIESKNPTITNKQKCVLVSGGSLGIGKVEKLVRSFKSDKFNYYILCGKNTVLYEKIKKKASQNIIPLPYISCRKKMNELYNKVDAIITKPGGVTISESIRKRKPTFVYDSLPGQEEINLEQLKQLGIVYDSKQWEKNSIEDHFSSYFEDREAEKKFNASLDDYYNSISDYTPKDLIQDFLN